MEIFSNKGPRRLYRGNIRNIEETDGPDLRGASTRIGEVNATDAVRFLKTIKSKVPLHPASPRGHRPGGVPTRRRATTSWR